MRENIHRRWAPQHLNFLSGTTFQTVVQGSEAKQVTVVSLLREGRDYSFKAIEAVGIYGAEYQRGKTMQTGSSKYPGIGFPFHLDQLLVQSMYVCI